MANWLECKQNLWYNIFRCDIHNQGGFVHFNVYLDEKMGVQLNKALKKEGGKTRNALIREAIQSWLNQRGGMWPKEVLLFKGIPNAPLFEQYREHLLPPKEEQWL